MIYNKRYQNICYPPGLVSGSAVAHLLDQFLATFICKVTKGLLGKGHLFATHLSLCRATLSTQRSSYLHLSLFPLPLLSLETSEPLSSIYMMLLDGEQSESALSAVRVSQLCDHAVHSPEL